LIIDHRDSPGVTPADLAHIPGAGVLAVPGGTFHESDILGCSHCQGRCYKNHDRVRDRGYCSKCDHYVCDRCEAIRVRTGECVPFAKILDVVQNLAEKYEGREDHPDATPPILLTDRFSY
jgi:hypothetical protein